MTESQGVFGHPKPRSKDACPLLTKGVRQCIDYKSVGSYRKFFGDNAWSPTLHALLDACDARTAQRAAGREAAKTATPPAPAAAPADLQALMAQAVAAALAGSPNDQAHGAPPSGAAPDDQQTGFCTLHQAAMELRENERGAWYSHYLEEEDHYCKGAKLPRRTGRR